MNLLFIALLPPLLWATCSFIDKFLISKYFKSSIETLIIYSCLIGLPVAFLILIFKPGVLNINLITSLFIIINSFIFILYLFPYFKALSKADVSTIVPIFETIPIFTFFLAFLILGETLTKLQIMGSIIIIIGAIGISLDLKKGFHIQKDVLFLQLLASFLIALNYSLFKFFAVELDFWTTSFWQYLGFFIFGLILMVFVKSYRNDFFKSFIKNKSSIIRLNVSNEIINIVAMIVFTFASLVAPVTIVAALSGVEPIYVFIMGLILSIFFPTIIKEDLYKKTIIKKIIFIALIVFGAYLLA